MRLSFVYLISLAFTLIASEAVASVREKKAIEAEVVVKSNTSNDHHEQLGLFETLLSPFRSTIDRAKNLLSDDSLQNAIRLQAYHVFLHIYNKTYPPEELEKRAQLFFERRKWIEESVKQFSEGRATFSMSENAFVDWSEQELKKLTGVSLPSSHELLMEARDGADDGLNVSSSLLDDSNLIVNAPASMDWRDSGCVSAPINQMKCGACYAIATMSVIETMRCLNSASSPILSPQQILDCASSRQGYQNFGCDGGWPTRVLKYLQDTGLATRDSCYPFVRRQNSCQMSRLVQTRNGECIVKASPTDSKRIQYKVLNNERDILHHVANTGPVVTVMKASNKFLYYGRGIFDDPSCSRRRDDVDHAIVIVGYGRENNVDYWLIKNSWGTTTWGQGGYGKYRRGTNACSVGHWGWVVTA